MNPLLGVSIPTYKRPDQLLETVRSVIVSGRDYGIPIFIADDSTDDTNTAVYEILRNEYPFIHVVRNEHNLGIDGNILHSVDINSCRYAWLLGEDDRLMPDAIKHVLCVLENDNRPFLYVNYSSVSGDFRKTLKPVSLPFREDRRVPSEKFWREYSWSAGFIGACVVSKSHWEKVARNHYLGTWFAHVGTIMEMCLGYDIPMIAEPLVQNRCGTTEVFTWTSSLMDVLDGWRRLCNLLEPFYGENACAESLESFRRAHGLGTVKFLAYARAGGALTPEVARNQILTGRESFCFKLWALVLSRLPAAWFRALQNFKHRFS
ncbi:MAG TPA: glycosyltransferase [Kiritimatiellia bacterium]|nr:glycosyltransferase [Kiritimatiellia bacterium]